MLPSRAWAAYEDALRTIGEKRGVPDADALAFLQSIEFVSPAVELTDEGRRFFHARFISGDVETTDETLRRRVLQLPEATAIAQLLAGVRGADRGRAETVLRSQGFGGSLTDREVGSLLMLMNRAGVIAYHKNSTGIDVLAQPAHQTWVPPSVFVSPETRFGNVLWLRRVIQECKDRVWWLDKHFQHVAFDALWEAVDGTRVSDVRVLSLRLPEHEGTRAARSYRALGNEFKNRGVALEWRTIDSSKVKQTHDRWIIGADSARNVPNVGAIYSGQHSELNRSDQCDELSRVFVAYWKEATPFSSGGHVE